jgi:hypothetical protein
MLTYEGGAQPVQLDESTVYRSVTVLTGLSLTETTTLKFSKSN